MKHISSSVYWRTYLLGALLLSGSFGASAQEEKSSTSSSLSTKTLAPLASLPVGTGLPTSRDRPAVAAFRQQLKQDETVRHLRLAMFLKGNPRVRRDYTDAKGAYHFIHHIDEKGQPVYYQTRSNLSLATSINTNKLWQGGSLGLNLQGQSMEVSQTRSRLGMWEPGALRATHREFGGRAITRDTPAFVLDSSGKGNANHATHVAGTMIATGVNPLARGMANQARLDCYEITANEYTEMQTAASEGMLVSNHSYGPDFDSTRVKLGVYDESSKTYDNITFQNKNYLQFHAAGNDRNDENKDRYDKKPVTYDILIGSANAKNVATVGAVKRLESGYKGPASVEMSDFSSYGPTDDGRIKPDFVAPGVDILSAYSGSDDAYSSINGTSMASPGSAGSLFLLQQHYRNKNNSFMRAATLKGLAIHTADEAGRNPGPDYEFGWGLINLERAIDLINKTAGLQVLEETSLANGATYRKEVTTAGGPFRTTICWTDVPGIPLVNAKVNDRTPLLVNDLDIRLIDLATNQMVAQLPWKLDPNNPTTGASRGDNIVDNVEQIFVDNLPAGQYAIQVTHKGTIQQGPQEFSLFVSSVATGGPVVKVNSTDPTAAEGGSQPTSGGRISARGARVGGSAADPGFIQFERSNTTGPLVVNYEIGGTATNGTDFATLPTSVTFADGQSVLIEEIDPIEDDIIEGDESIIITLLDSDAYDPDPDNSTTTVTIKDKASAAFSITGVTTVSCLTLSAGQRQLSFSPQYAGATGQPISFSVVNELLPTTASGSYTLKLYTDNPTIVLKASQTGTMEEASFSYNWLAACTSGTTPPTTGTFSLTGVTTVSCTTLSAGQRRLSFMPRYAGATGQPVSFSVSNEMVPTTAPGPYTLNLYTDNPVILLQAMQSGTNTSFAYNWLAACTPGARLGAEPGAGLQIAVLGNPIHQVLEALITGAEGNALQLVLTDGQGRVLNRHTVEQATASERVRFNVDHQPSGMLLLRATTPTQAKTVKLLKAE